MSLMIYDTETMYLSDQVDGGWDNPAAMKLGVGCIYNVVQDKYNFYMPKQEEQMALDLQGHSVVSYNGKRFDSCIIQETNTPSFEMWEDIDLLEVIACAKHGGASLEQAFGDHGKFNVLNGSLGLDVVCEKTLGFGKSAKLGALAPRMLKDGHWASLFGYVLQDVRRLRQLFEYIVNHGFVIDGHGNTVEIENVRIG